MGKLIIDSPDATYHYCGSCGNKVSYRENECSTCGGSFEENRSFQVSSEFNPQLPIVSQLSIFENSDVTKETKPAITKKLQVSSGNALFFYCNNCRQSTNRKSIECSSCGAFFDGMIEMDSEARNVNSADSQEVQFSDDWQPPKNEHATQEIESEGTWNHENPTDTIQYIGFWKRVGAYVLDFIIIFIIVFVFGFFGVLWFGDAAVFSDSFYDIFGIVLTWLYFAWYESSDKQATPGKMAIHAKVVDTDGYRLTFGRATGRHFAKILSGIILGVGFLIVAFHPEKKGLHDHIANTYVIKSK